MTQSLHQQCKTVCRIFSTASHIKARVSDYQPVRKIKRNCQSRSPNGPIKYGHISSCSVQTERERIVLTLPQQTDVHMEKEAAFAPEERGPAQRRRKK
mmetsp:Transcript_53728/g.105075  ORF Transcript_53728/g.105075 Transcript_53728/m.105075 type:complete len:98 (-) Transcript_53728:2979-3272(-)